MQKKKMSQPATQSSEHDDDFPPELIFLEEIDDDQDRDFDVTAENQDPDSSDHDNEEADTRSRGKVAEKKKGKKKKKSTEVPFIEIPDDFPKNEKHILVMMRKIVFCLIRI